VCSFWVGGVLWVCFVVVFFVFLGVELSECTFYSDIGFYVPVARRFSSFDTFSTRR